MTDLNTITPYTGKGCGHDPHDPFHFLYWKVLIAWMDSMLSWEACINCVHADYPENSNGKILCHWREKQLSEYNPPELDLSSWVDAVSLCVAFKLRDWSTFEGVMAR